MVASVQAQVQTHGRPIARRVAPGTHPRPGLMGGVRVFQVVLLELAAVLVAVALVRGSVLLTAALVLPVALALAGALLRWRGRWLATWPGVLAAYRTRRAMRSHPAPGADPGLAPVRECAPALGVVSVAPAGPAPVPGGREAAGPVGVAGDGTFLTAVLLVESGDGPLRPPASAHGLPLDVLGDALVVDDVTLSSVQVVQHTRPAPAVHLPTEALAARSYHQLAADLGTEGVPALRVTWVALRFEPESCARAVAARGGGVTGAQRALLRAVHHLAGRLRDQGLSARPLTGDELTQALAMSCGVNPQVRQYGRGGRRTAETRQAWRCDDRWHTVFRAGRWPDLTSGRLGAAAALLTSAPALASTFALTLEPGARDAVRMSAHVRLMAPSTGELAHLSRELEHAARRARIGLTRLDFEQQPGLLATLPLGGMP